MKNRSLFTKSGAQPPIAQVLGGLLIAIVCLGLASCHSDAYYYYKFPQYTFANRPIPPSKLANRVMVGVTTNGVIGTLAILDGKRDIRSNIENTIKFFSISGYSGGYPDKIFNFPEEVRGYVFSDSDGSLANINYSTESSSGTVATFAAKSTGLGVPQSFSVYAAAVEIAGQVELVDNATGRTFALNLPNAYQVAVNPGGTIVLAMVRNSNTLYRVIKLNSNQAPPPGAVDCQPLRPSCLLRRARTRQREEPRPSIAPSAPTSPSTAAPSTFSTAVPSAAASRPASATCRPAFSISTSSLILYHIRPLSLASLPVPGGVTAALSDGTTLYVAGQQLQPDGLFAGFLSTISLATNTVTGKYSISDGNHSKMLFADNNTLWIGSQLCATGERAHQAALGVTTQAANYNCLTSFNLGAKTAMIVPNVTPGSPTATVPYPNTDSNQYYYGSLTGLCWVQNYHKIYTAYGGQIHSFNTTDGSEIDNFNITVQGTALDVAYMDAVTDGDN